MVEIFKSYFEGKFDEASIKKNFVLIYELLDGTGFGRSPIFAHNLTKQQKL